MTEPALDTYPDVFQSFKITGIVILGMVVLSPVKLVLNNSMDQEIAEFLSYLLAIGLPFWYVYSIRRNITGIHSFHLALENKRVIPVLIIGTVVLQLGMIAPLVDLLPVPDWFQRVVAKSVSPKGIFTFISMVIAAPILEELIFRGIILDGLLKIYSPLQSILISSFLFGLVHLNLYQLVGGFLFGIFTSWVYYRTRSLLTAILMHAGVNLSGFLMRYFINVESSMESTLVKSYGGLLNLILATGGSVVIFLICVYYLSKQFIKISVKNNATPALTYD